MKSHRWLYRYIAAEFLFSSLVAFCFFFFIFFINQLLLLAEDLLAKKAAIFDVLLLVVYSLPAIVALAIPFAVLLGVLMCLGKLSSGYELVAFQAGGVSLTRIFLVLLVLSTACASFSFLMNEFFLPVGTISFGQVYRRLVLSTPQLELEPFAVKRYENTAIVTGRPLADGFESLLIVDRDADNRRRIIVAEKGALDASNPGAISLALDGVSIHTTGYENEERHAFTRAQSMLYSILFKNLAMAYREPGPREMSSLDLWSEIQKRRRTGGAEFDRMLQLFEIEFHKKMALPFACIPFLLFSFPVGALQRKGGRIFGFGIGIVLCVLYWALLLLGQTFGMRMPISPLLAMWAPNFVVLALAAVAAGLYWRR
jgi:lipopolysaccharide export system permease protein